MAILAIVGTTTDAWFDHQAQLEEAKLERRDMLAEKLHARFAGEFCFDTDHVRVELVNNGTARLNATKITFVVDGTPVTGWNIDNTEKTGSHVWLPSEQVYFNSTSIASPPDNIVLVTQHGALHNVTRTDCRYLTTIVLTPASATIQGGASQDFSAQGFDQYGDPMTGITFSWTTDAGSITPTDADSATLTAGYTPGAALVVEATSGGVTGTATITVQITVHVDALATYNGATPTATFARGDTVTGRVVIRDHGANLVEGASVTVTFTRPAGLVEATVVAVTDASGVSLHDYALPGNAQRGTWTVTVTDVTGGQMTYDSASNVITSTTFEVT